MQLPADTPSEDSDNFEAVYEELSVFARRARELSADLHPGLTLTQYTLLSFVQARPGTRATDIAAAFGVEKSTVSRQLDQLAAATLLRRGGDHPDLRGQVLTLTAKGRRALDTAARSIRSALEDQLGNWDAADVATFARLLARFNSGR
jgi:DNA-binding MarR family transcriptional regulator